MCKNGPECKCQTCEREKRAYLATPGLPGSFPLQWLTAKGFKELRQEKVLLFDDRVA